MGAGYPRERVQTPVDAAGRVPLVAGNWKMHTTLAEGQRLARAVAAGAGRGHGVELVVCPPFTGLAAVRAALGGAAAARPAAAGTPAPGRAAREGGGVGLGAQDVFWEAQGAFTGEVSAAMLADAGCRYVVVGHSERRHLLGEADEQVRRKVRAALEHGLRPILCVGETLEQRDAGVTEAVVGEQLSAALQGLDAGAAAAAPGGPAGALVVAYEPVWAIGTGRPATPEDAQAVAGFIRRRLAGVWGSGPAAAVRILYGGSVKPQNAADFFRLPDVDGALVGGASLDAEAFLQIAAAAVER